jgi:Domain of unknown function (DUF4105)
MKKIFLLFVLFIFNNNCKAQKKISLLTCGIGQELYSCFGHSAIRIIDSATARDEVYNYGMFNFGAPYFYLKFTRGTLPYFGAKQTFESFMQEYLQDKRMVQEQVLNLNASQIAQVELALENSLMEANKYYHYDFCFNNCSTKIRDIMDSIFKNEISYGAVIPADSITYMQLLDSYLQNKHWERVGIDVILSSKVNDKMNSYQSMFLPKGLHDNFGAATINGAPFVANEILLLPPLFMETKSSNEPKIIFQAISIALIILSLIFRNKTFWHYFDNIWFVLLGILGLFFIGMWLATDHSETNTNLNMLWALPLHLGFVKWRTKKWFSNYCVICIVLCILLMFPIHQYVQPTALEIFPLIFFTILRLLWNSNFKNYFSKKNT